MSRLVCLLAMLLLAAAPAAAQTQGSVIEHYRAYTAAIGQGDLAAAEAAAERALAASQARDGDGGSTAVLAFNLATTRLLRGNPDGALGPAQLAHRLSAIADSGVDPLATQLVLGRAEIAQQETSRSTAAQGARRIRDALPAAEPRAELIGEVYPAATALGAWAFGQNR